MRSLEEQMARLKDIESSALEMGEDLKYPVNEHGHVMFVHYTHPDLIPGLVHHLIKCGWRKDPDKRVVKRRPVVGTQFQDLVAYVPVDEPDEPIRVTPETPPREEGWSVTPVVNVIDEKRPE